MTRNSFNKINETLNYIGLTFSLDGGALVTWGAGSLGTGDVRSRDNYVIV